MWFVYLCLLDELTSRGAQCHTDVAKASKDCQHCKTFLSVRIKSLSRENLQSAVSSIRLSQLALTVAEFNNLPQAPPWRVAGVGFNLRF